jgi:hypothetical protein
VGVAFSIHLVDVKVGGIDRVAADVEAGDSGRERLRGLGSGDI